MVVGAGCTQIAQAAFGPELTGAFEAALAAQTGRLHRPTADGPAPVSDLLVLHPLRLTSELLVLLVEGFTSLATGAFERGELFEHRRLFPVA